MNHCLSVQTVVCAVLFTGACTVTTTTDDGGSSDGATSDGGIAEGGTPDTGASTEASVDSGTHDAGSQPETSVDTGTTQPDAGSTPEAAADGGAQDTGSQTEAATDTGTSEGGATYNTTEPNDDFAHANTIHVGDTVNGTFSGSDDTDYLVISIPAGNEDGVLTVTVNKGTNNTMAIDVYDSTQTRFDGNNASATTSPFVSSYQLTAGSTYYLRLTSGGDGTYSMTTSFAPVPDTYERNDDFPQAKAAPVGTAFNVYIFAGHDTNMGTDLDYFTLAVPANATKVAVSFTNNSTSQLPQSYSLTLYDPSKSYVAASNGAGQANISDMWTLPNTTGGTYYVKFTSGQNSTVASSATLTPQ